MADVITARHGLISKGDFTDLTAQQAQNLGEKAPIAQYQIPPEVCARLRKGLKFELYVPVQETVDIAADANATYDFAPAIRYANPAGGAGGSLPFERRLYWSYSDGPTLGTAANTSFNANGTITGPKTTNAGTLTVQYLAGAGELSLDLLTNANAGIKRKQIPIWRGNAAAANGVFQYAEGAELTYQSDVLAMEYMVLVVSAKLGAAVSLTSRLAVINLDFEDFAMSELDAIFRAQNGGRPTTRAQLISAYVAHL